MIIESKWKQWTQFNEDARKFDILSGDSICTIYFDKMVAQTQADPEDDDDSALTGSKFPIRRAQNN